MFSLPRCLLGGLAVLALTGCAPRSTSDPIQMGHLAPLSGPHRPAGEHARQAIDVAVQELDADPNRLLGRPLQVQHADSAGGAEAVTAQAVRLLATDRVVALLGGTDPDQLEALVRADQSYKVPLVAPGTLAATVGNDYTFSESVDPTYQGQLLARFTTQELKPSRVSVLTDSRSNVATNLATAFIQQVARNNSIAAEEWTYRAGSDFADLLGHVKKSSPQVVLVAGSAEDVLKLRPQLHEAATEAKLICGVPEGSLGTLQEDRSVAGQAFLATVYTEEGLTAAGEEFAKKYQEAAHQQPDVHAALAYDGIRLLAEAVRRAHSTAPSQVRAELARFTRANAFDTLTGPLFFTEDHVARRAVFVLRLEAGKAQMARRYDPEAPE